MCVNSHDKTFLIVYSASLTRQIQISLEVHMGREETISLSVMTAAALRIYQVYVIPLQYVNDVRTCDT